MLGTEANVSEGNFCNLGVIVDRANRGVGHGRVLEEQILQFGGCNLKSTQRLLVFHPHQQTGRQPTLYT